MLDQTNFRDKFREKDMLITKNTVFAQIRDTKAEMLFAAALCISMLYTGREKTLP